MSEEEPGFSAQLKSGPFDGAAVGFDLDPSDLPQAVVLSFVVGEQPTDLASHSYLLDRVHRVFRYLGEATTDESQGEPPIQLDPGPEGQALADAADDALTIRFYELLFERCPELRELFAADIRPQAAMLGTALRATIGHLGDGDWLITALRTLGAQHAQWGVTEPMYAAFGECMSSALSERAPGDWTPEAADAWDSIFCEVRDLMLDGAARATRDEGRGSDDSDGNP